MGVCEYCGEKAGWFQASHPACVSSVQHANETLGLLIADRTASGKNYSEIETEINKVLEASNVQFKHVRTALLQAANDVASQIALNSPIPTPEFTRLVDIIRGLDGTRGAYLSDDFRSQMISRRWHAMAQLQMSYVLWQVLNGITPELDDRPAFNLRSGETPIFQTGNCVTFAEERTISNRTRSYQGLSIPIGGGIYYHIGGSQGHQERTSGLVPIDGGQILVTSQALYFGGQSKTLRIALDRVLRYQSYIDAVGVCESHGAPKVFIFDYRGMDVGWFFFNLLMAITNGSSLQRSTNDATEERLATIHAAIHSNVALQEAFGSWLAENDSFTELVKNVVNGTATLTSDDFSRYSEAAELLLVAAREFGQNSDFVAPSHKQLYDEALKQLQKRWEPLASVGDGQINGDALAPFINEVAEFMKARSNYCNSDTRLSPGVRF